MGGGGGVRGGEGGGVGEGAKGSEAKGKEGEGGSGKVNGADAKIWASEKQLKGYGDKIPGEKKSAIEGALATLKEAHKNADIPAIDKAIEDLNAAWQAASQDIYAQQQAQEQANTGAGADAGAQGSDGASQPEDVEFEEVK